MKNWEKPEIIAGRSQLPTGKNPKNSKNTLVKPLRAWLLLHNLVLVLAARPGHAIRGRQGL